MFMSLKVGCSESCISVLRFALCAFIICRENVSNRVAVTVSHFFLIVHVSKSEPALSNRINFIINLSINGQCSVCLQETAQCLLSKCGGSVVCFSA